MIYSGRWSAIRRGRGDLPPIVDGLQFFGDLTSSRTSIVSGAVATLGDASGYDRDATQATAGRRPTYNASDANFGGMPTMTGDGVGAFLLTPSFSYGAGGNFASVYVGFRTPATLGTQTVEGVTISTNGSTSTRLDATHGISSYFTATGNTIKNNAAIAADTNYRACAVYDTTIGASSITQYLNGSSAGSYLSTGAVDGVALVSASHYILSINASVQFFSGTLAYILAYAASHSGSQHAIIDDWLKWRFGL